MITKRGQTLYDIAVQAYGSVQDVFKLIKDNPDKFPKGLSTQLPPGTEIKITGESSAPRVQRAYKRSGREPGTADSINASVEVLSATVSNAYVGQDVTATVQVKNTGLRPAIGDLIFDWGFKQEYAVAVFLLPGQELTVTDTVENVSVNMLGSHTLDIFGVASYSLSYKIKGTTDYLASNAIDANTDFVLRIYDETIQLTSIVSASGIASVTVDAGKVKCTASGTLYDLKVSDGNNNYHFPLAEGYGWTVHDVNYGERAIIANYTWTNQDNLHHNLYKGTTELDTGNGLIYVPYNNARNKIYTNL